MYLEVAPGVAQLRQPIPENPLGFLNAYLMEGNKGYVLIDTGWPSQEALDALKAGLAEMGLGLKDITTILVTHGHVDHLGLAGQIREHGGAQVLLHRLDVPDKAPIHSAWRRFSTQMRRWLRVNGIPQEMLDLQHRPPSILPDFDWRIQPDQTLEGGETLSFGRFSLQSIWTPGHSNGHLCYYEPERGLLFSGDHILPVITPHVSYTHSTLPNPLSHFLDSLEKVEGLEVSGVFPAHEHIFSDLRGRVEQIKAHHHLRTQELLESLGDGEKTAYQIALRMSWNDISGIVLGEGLPVSQIPGAMTETLAHLEWLRHLGRVERVRRNGIFLYHQGFSPQTST